MYVTYLLILISRIGSRIRASQKSMTVIISIVYYTILCKAGFLHNNAMHSALKLRKSKWVPDCFRAHPDEKFFHYTLNLEPFEVNGEKGKLVNGFSNSVSNKVESSTKKNQQEGSSTEKLNGTKSDSAESSERRKSSMEIFSGKNRAQKYEASQAILMSFTGFTV